MYVGLLASAFAARCLSRELWKASTAYVAANPTRRTPTRPRNQAVLVVVEHDCRCARANPVCELAEPVGEARRDCAGNRLGVATLFGAEHVSPSLLSLPLLALLALHFLASL